IGSHAHPALAFPLPRTLVQPRTSAQPRTLTSRGKNALRSHAATYTASPAFLSPLSPHVPYAHTPRPHRPPPRLPRPHRPRPRMPRPHRLRPHRPRPHARTSAPESPRPETPQAPAAPTRSATADRGPQPLPGAAAALPHRHGPGHLPEADHAAVAVQRLDPLGRDRVGLVPDPHGTGMLPLDLVEPSPGGSVHAVGHAGARLHALAALAVLHPPGPAPSDRRVRAPGAHVLAPAPSM